MGLDCSHDAFSGQYSGFNRLRKIVASAAGGSFPPHDDWSLDVDEWYVGDQFTKESHPGLFLFLGHSDCSGDISPEECAQVADDLESLIPKIREWEERQDGGMVVSPTVRSAGYAAAIQRFVDGCRRARARKEALTFR